MGSCLTAATRWGRSRCLIREAPLCRNPDDCRGNRRGTLVRWKHLNLRLCCSLEFQSPRRRLVNARVAQAGGSNGKGRDGLRIDRRTGVGRNAWSLFQRCAERRGLPARPRRQGHDRDREAARDRRHGAARLGWPGGGRPRHRLDVAEGLEQQIAAGPERHSRRGRLQRPDHRCRGPRLCRFARLQGVRRRTESRAICTSSTSTARCARCPTA